MAGKDRQGTENGYGPWALYVDAAFAGWCGFQKEGDDADLAMVLTKRFWGLGRRIYPDLVRRGFEDFGWESIVVTLPPSRRSTRVLERLGFVPDGEADRCGHRLLRYRLSKADWMRSSA